MDWVENRLNHHLQSIDQDNTEFLTYLSNTQTKIKERSNSFESEDITALGRETEKDSLVDVEMTIDDATVEIDGEQIMTYIDQFIMQYSVEIHASNNIEDFVDEVIHESKKGDHQPILNSYHLMNEQQLNILMKHFENNPKWTKQHTKVIAKELGLNRYKVYKWNWEQRKKLKESQPFYDQPINSDQTKIFEINYQKD